MATENRDRIEHDAHDDGESPVYGTAVPVVEVSESRRTPEPARIAGFVTSILTAVLTVLALQVDGLSVEVQTTIVTAAGSFIVAVLGLMEIVRQQVVPVGKANDRIVEAYYTNPNEPSTHPPLL